MTTHEAGKLLWTYGADISRFVNTLEDVSGVTVYTADEIVAMTVAPDGYVTICEYRDRETRETYFLEIHPETGHIREAY